MTAETTKEEADTEKEAAATSAEPAAEEEAAAEEEEEEEEDEEDEEEVVDPKEKLEEGGFTRCHSAATVAAVLAPSLDAIAEKDEALECGFVAFYPSLLGRGSQWPVDSVHVFFFIFFIFRCYTCRDTR